jgi:NAD(P)-dependent dehydrogenase (short-subunit alcohol dehydrogenase family)
MTRFSNKIALVTGGAGAIGRATVLRFAQEGAHVVVVDRNMAQAKQVVSEVEMLGRQAIAIEADVTVPEDNARAVARTMERFGHLDVVFANAGIAGSGDPVMDLDVAAWDRIIAVNLRGVFLTCKYALPAMITSSGGAIVTMASSMAGWDALAGGSGYMASKEAVTGLTKSLALEGAGYGIRVNAICPGVIETRLSVPPGTTEEARQARFRRFAQRIPLRRVGQPEDVAATVAFLASEDARHITGALLLIDGGQTLQSWSNAPDGDAYPYHLPLGEASQPEA